jgi:hypothetical protein
MFIDEYTESTTCQIDLDTIKENRNAVDYLNSPKWHQIRTQFNHPVDLNC